MNKKAEGKAKGGFARAASLTPEERKRIAREAARARWASNDGEVPEAAYEGVLTLGDELECYVLKDQGRVKRVFHKRGLARNLGMKSGGGNVFMRTISRKGLGSVISPELRQKLENPLIFKTIDGDLAHGYEGSVLIDICDAIWEASRQGLLHSSQKFLAIQAEIILRASAKLGISALIDEATGYVRDKQKEEYRALFQEYIREEAREYAREFPDQFFNLIYRLYNLRRNQDAKNHPQFFAWFIRKYVYSPLAHSNGALLEILDEKNPVVYTKGGRKYKMFQFLSDVVGLPALRAQIWQVIGIGNASTTKAGFDRNFERAFPSTGHQFPLFDFDEGRD